LEQGETEMTPTWTPKHTFERIIGVLSSFQKAKTIHEVVQEIGIPYTKCYSQVRSLIDLGLLKKVAELPTSPNPWVKKHVFQLTEEVTEP